MWSVLEKATTKMRQPMDMTTKAALWQGLWCLKGGGHGCGCETKKKRRRKRKEGKLCGKDRKGGTEGSGPRMRKSGSGANGLRLLNAEVQPYGHQS